MAYDATAVILGLNAGLRLGAAELTYDLCTAASYDTSGTAVSALLAAGASTVTCSGGRPPLQWAMMSGNAAAVRVLCAAGADVHALSEDGERGLVMSVFIALSEETPPTPERAFVEALRALADAGRDITRCVALHRAYAPLCAAAHYGAARVLACLLDAGAVPNDRTGAQASALHFAVERPLLSRREARLAVEQSLRCVRCLLRAGANTRARRFDGSLAVHSVLLVGDLRIADAIFEAEDRRGVNVDDAPPGTWAALLERERTLRAAVAEYRRTGDASLPEVLRVKTRLTISWTPPAGEADGEAALELLGNQFAVRGTDFRRGRVPQAETEAMQADIAALVPRSVDETHRCAAPGCGMLGAALKICPCKGARYCRCVAAAMR